MPLVLLHAFPMTSWMWEAQRSALSDLCHVITPDLRGFGASDPHDLSVGAEPDLDRMADDVAGVLDRYGLRRAVVGGLSMGGYVAMAFARKYPDRLEGLVLADTKAEADSEDARKNRLRIADTVLHEGSARVLVDEMAVPGKLYGRTTASQRPHVADSIRWLVEQAHPTGVAWAQRAMAARPDYRASLADVDVPTLVLAGDEDEMTPPAQAEELAGLVKGAQLKVLAGSGHLSAMETPGEFDVALRGWMKELLAARRRAGAHGHVHGFGRHGHRHGEESGRHLWFTHRR